MLIEGCLILLKLSLMKTGISQSLAKVLEIPIFIQDYVKRLTDLFFLADDKYTGCSTLTVLGRLLWGGKPKYGEVHVYRDLEYNQCKVT